MTYSDKLVHIQVVIFVMTLRGDVVEVSDLIFTEVSCLLVSSGINLVNLVRQPCLTYY